MKFFLSIILLTFCFSTSFSYGLQSEDANLVLSKNDLNTIKTLQSLEFVKHTVFKNKIKIKIMPKLSVDKVKNNNIYEKLVSVYGLKTKFYNLNDIKFSKEIKFKTIKPISYPQRIKVPYYGIDLRFSYDVYMVDNLDITLFKKNKFIDIYKFFASTEYQPLIGQINNIKNVLRLDDWSTYELVVNMSNKIFSSKNVKQYFIWFIMVKLGYDFRLAYDQNGNYYTMVMSKSEDNNFSKHAFVKINNIKYYLLTDTKNIKLLYTYDNDINLSPIDMNITTYPNLQNYAVKSKKINFISDNGKKYNLTIEANNMILNYYRDYPQLNYKTYLGVPFSDKARSSLNDFFFKLYNGSRNNIEFINNVLNFVQNFDNSNNVKSLENKYNMDFLENIIFSDNNNIYNKNILFSYLIKNFLHLSTIVVNYNSGYALTGISISSDSAWLSDIKNLSTLKYKGNTYILLDPYLKGSRVGYIELKKLGKVKSIFDLINN